MKNFNSNTENSQEWYTPPEIFLPLGHFDLDPACPKKPLFNVADEHFYTNGLDEKWFGRVWLNPPYGRETFKWIEKLAAYGRGTALIFARTETKGFQHSVFNRASALLFIAGRIKFYRPNGIQGNCANAPSVLIAYGHDDAEILRNCGIKGKFVSLE